MKAFISALAACMIFAPLAEAKKAAKGPDTQEIKSLMKDVDREASYITRGIRSQKSKEDVAGSIGRLRSAFQKMKGLTPSKGDPELFHQYCDVSLGILADVETQVDHSYWSEAENSFVRIKDLKKDIDRDFVPGAWENFRSWLKRIF